MARTPRNEVSRARRGVSVREKRRIVRSPVNDPAAASIAWIQHNGTYLSAPSDIMGSSLVPSSGLEVQPGCLADGLDVHQPTCMGLQPSRTELDVLTLAELDATQRLENIDIGAANLQTVFPLDYGNQPSESIRASLFQSYGSLASVLSCGAMNPTSNALNGASTPPTASDYDLPASLCLCPEAISPLPEILPLKEAEKSHMLDQLFPPEQDQSLENASFLSPQKQLYQPNNLEGRMQMVNYDPPGHSHTSLSLLPLGEMIHHSATHPQSFPFEHWHQKSPQQPLIDLDGDQQKQLLGSAPFHSFSSNEPCAMEYPASSLLSSNSNVITAIVPNIVEAAPTVNITPFDSLAQSAATSTLPNCALIPNGSAHSASANHTNAAARIVMAGRGRVPRNRVPQSRRATVGRLRQIRTASTPDASPATVNRAEVMLGRIETQRQNHMKSERKKRQQMNELYATIRNLLPPATRKIRPDNATVVQDMINYIKRSKNELERLEQQLKHSQQLVAALRNVNPSIHNTDTAVARLLTTKGYTCMDHTHDPSALTAVTTLPAFENYSGLGSFLGTNVAINYCHDSYSLTVSSPYLGKAVALLEPMLIAIQNHHLEVLFASIVTTGNTHIYFLQCKASPHTELLRNNLHSVLQGIVNNFPSSSSSQEHYE